MCHAALPQDDRVADGGVRARAGWELIDKFQDIFAALGAWLGATTLAERNTVAATMSNWS